MMATENIASKSTSVEVGNAAVKKISFNAPSIKDYLTNEAYKSLRTNLMFCGDDIKTILITSTAENEGKSTFSVELAKCISDLGKNTLLIDADMRKSVMLKRSVRSEDIHGLSEILSGQATVEDVIYNTSNTNFDVIFAGQFPPNPVELLENGRFKQMLNDLKEVYDYIIIDSPPLGAVIDAAVIAAFCDGAIMIFAERKVSRKAALDVKDQLEKSGCRILGGVINEATKSNTKYYRKYYRKYYNKYYSKTYR